jgi:hypothetical protein
MLPLVLILAALAFPLPETGGGMDELLARAEPYPLVPPPSKRTVRKVDQALIDMVEAAERAADPSSNRRANADALKGYVERYGWFPEDEWGWRVGWNAGRIVQNAEEDPAFQLRVLKTIAPLAEAERTSAKQVAYLHDRVAVGAGLPQRYATQGACTKEGGWRPFPTEDLGKARRLRETVGLEPLEDAISAESSACPSR